MSEALARGLETVVGEHLGRPVEVTGLRRLAGGASHETWGFAVTDGPGLVLRRDFTSGLLATDLRAEYDLLAALHAAGVPVPAPVLCGADDDRLGTPWMLMERVEGTDLRKALARGDAQDCAAEVVDLQARIHAVPVTAVAGLLEGDGAAGEAQRWATVHEEAKADLDPLLAAALGWLEVHVPAPVEPRVVHADFKANNLLHGPAGLTVLDWEMAHLGDPVEDLAWTLLWRTGHDVVGGLHTQEAYLEQWSSRTGLDVEPARLRWWQVLSLVKLWAIFSTGMAGDRVRPTLWMLGRATVWLQHETARAMSA